MFDTFEKLFEREKEVLELSRIWAQKATEYDRYAELAVKELFTRQHSKDFTSADYNHYLSVISDDQELAYLARLRSCVFYRKYTKIRRKREKFVASPRHQRRSK